MKILLTSLFAILIFCRAEAQPDEVLSLMNEVRTDPQGFLNKRVIPYLKENDLEENPYAKSLVEDLKVAKKVGELQMSAALTKTARSHARDMGQHGTIGHNSSDGTSFPERIPKKFKTGMIAENCDYGNAVPLDIVMALLIDDGIASLGHRKNILHPTLNFVGIAIEEHKTYRTNCVMDFSQND